MARKVNVTQGVQAAGASYTVANGEHLTGDLLLNYLVLDADQAAASNPSIGFANSVATITAAADTVGYAGADVWTDGDQVTFTGTTLPGGLTNEVRYFVRDLNTGAKTFKVAATSGGAAIDITSTGTSVTVTQVTAGANSPYNGWQMIGTQAVNKGIRTVWAFKVAASAAEGNVTYVAGSNDWIGASYVYRDAHETAPFGSLVDGTDFARAEWGDAATGASAPLTSPVDGCLLLYSWGIDGNAHFGRCNLNDLTGLDKYSASNINYVVGYRQQETAGAAPSVTMYSEVATEGGSTWTLAIRNKTGGALQPDIRPDINELKWYSTWNEEYDGSTTWNQPSTFCTGVTDFGGIVLSATAPTVANNTTAVDKFIWNTTVTSLTSTENITLLAGEGGLGAWVGGWHTIPSTDLTGKIVGAMWEIGAGSGSAQQGSEGVLFGFSDGTNCVLYQVVTKAFGWFGSAGEFAFVAVGNATEYDSAGTVATVLGACTRFGLFRHRITSSTTTQYVAIRDLAVFGPTALTGGGADYPARFQDFQEAITSWGQWDFAKLTASAQIVPKSSVQIGDGTNTTYFDGSAQSLEFPQAWSASKRANWQMSWNALDDSVDLIVKAKSGDTVNLASGVAATDTGQNLIIHADSSLSATYNFAQSFVGWRSVVDNVGLPWTGATFKECGTVTIAGGGDLTNCTIAKTSSGNAALAITANGTTLDGCTIDVTGTSAAYHLELGTSVTAIALTDVTFTGTPGTDKVHVLATTGTVTITISGTTNIDSDPSVDVTSAGATVVIAAPSPTLDATVLANTRTVLWNRTTSAELDNTWITGTSWSKAITSGASSGDVLDLYAFKEGYLESVATIIYSGTDATFALEQAVDPAIDYYRTTESITDYTTLSEFNFYAPDIYIQSDDADGATSLKRLFIYYNGALTTEDGARYMRGGITFRSAFDVVINRSVVPVAVDNVSATLGLYFTDEATIRVTTDDGTSWIAPPSAPGSIRYAFGVSPGQIETTGSSVITGTAADIIAAIPSASANATAVWAKTLP